MSLTVHPLTAQRWPALEDLFGPVGASNGCWCLYWRIGAGYKRRPREQNKQEFRALAGDNPSPGLLAFDGDLAVGWCQLTPRTDLPWLDHGARYRGRVDDLPVWSLSCFYVRRGYRRHGVTAVLIDAALRAAQHAGAPAVEAYPIDTAVPEHTSNLFTGTAATFERAGFTVVARRSPSHPVMRHDLKSIS